MNVKETADGYIGIHKGQFEFIGGPLKGSMGDMTIQVSLDKEYNFSSMKRVMASDGRSLSELTINVTDFK